MGCEDGDLGSLGTHLEDPGLVLCICLYANVGGGEYKITGGRSSEVGYRLWGRDSTQPSSLPLFHPH